MPSPPVLKQKVPYVNKVLQISRGLPRHFGDLALWEGPEEKLWQLDMGGPLIILGGYGRNNGYIHNLTFLPQLEISGVSISIFLMKHWKLICVFACNPFFKMYMYLYCMHVRTCAWTCILASFIENDINLHWSMTDNLRSLRTQSSNH